MGATIDELRKDGAELDETLVRDRFNQALELDGRPVTQIALETGVAYATLAAWRHDKYSGNNEKIASRVEAWLLTRQARSRTRAVIPDTPRFILTPTAEDMLNVLELAQTLPDIAVIAGPAGIGKTCTIQQYRRTASNVFIATMEPSFQSISSILIAIAESMGVPRVRGANELSDQIQRRLRGTKSLLILDEAQNLFPQAVDQIRVFHDRCEIGIAMVGNETVAKRYGAERMTAEYAPLFSRVGQRLRPKGLKVKDLDMLITGWKLEDEGVRKVLRQIGRAAGAARLMSKTIRMGFFLAMAEDRTTPNKGDIEAAWAQLTARDDGSIP